MPSQFYEENFYLTDIKIYFHKFGTLDVIK